MHGIIIIRWVAIIAIKLETLKTLEDMDKVIIRYENNSSVRYDGKEYFEAFSKLHWDKTATRTVQVGESIRMKTKSRIWKAVVVDPTPIPASQRK